MRPPGTVPARPLPARHCHPRTSGILRAVTDLCAPDVTLRDRRPEDVPALARWLTDPAAEWRAWDAPYTPAAPSLKHSPKASESKTPSSRNSAEC